MWTQGPDLAQCERFVMGLNALRGFFFLFLFVVVVVVIPHTWGMSPAWEAHQILKPKWSWALKSTPTGDTH